VSSAMFLFSRNYQSAESPWKSLGDVIGGGDTEQARKRWTEEWVEEYKDPMMLPKAGISVVVTAGAVVTTVATGGLGTPAFVGVCAATGGVAAGGAAAAAAGAAAGVAVGAAAGGAVRAIQGQPTAAAAAEELKTVSVVQKTIPAAAEETLSSALQKLQSARLPPSNMLNGDLWTGYPSEVIGSGSSTLSGPGSSLGSTCGS